MKGQLALIDRGRFCPGRDCHTACGIPGGVCRCKPCRPTCPCRQRAARPLRRTRRILDGPPPLAPRHERLIYMPAVRRVVA